MWLGARAISSVVLGTKAEAAEIEAICTDNPHAVNFMGKSKIVDIPDFARGAEIVVGNDTGPTHMCRLAGAKTVLLLPASSAHLLKNTQLQRALIADGVKDISVITVQSAMNELLKQGGLNART